MMPMVFPGTLAHAPLCHLTSILRPSDHHGAAKVPPGRQVALMRLYVRFSAWVLVTPPGQGIEGVVFAFLNAIARCMPVSKIEMGFLRPPVYAQNMPIPPFLQETYTSSPPSAFGHLEHAYPNLDTTEQKHRSVISLPRAHFLARKLKITFNFEPPGNLISQDFQKTSSAYFFS